MNKIILIVAITLGLSLTVSAQSRGHNGSNQGHSNNGYSNNGHSNNRYSNHGHSNHHSTRSVRIWVPGYTTRVWCPPRYQYVRQPCGRLVRVCVSHGHYDSRYVSGYYRSTNSGYNSGCNSSGVRISWRF